VISSPARTRHHRTAPIVPAWRDPWLAWSLAWVLLTMALDLAAGPDVSFYGVLVGAPFVAGVGSTTRRTLASALLAIVGAVCLSMVNDVQAAAVLVRLAALVAASAIAVVVADIRGRRDQRLRDVSHIVAVAQEALLRPVPSAIGGWAFAARYEPAGDLGVGGDLYDVAVTADGSLLAIVADVQGKGVGAVADAARLLAAFRTGAHEARSFADLAQRLEAAVDPGSEGEKFITALVCRFETGGRVDLVNFGHPPPVLVHGGRVAAVTPPVYEPPLGLGPDLVVQSVVLAEGDALLCFTDGLIEARVDSGAFHDPLPALRAARPCDPGDHVEVVVRSVTEATSGLHDDDLTVLAAMWLPSSARSDGWQR
jgi:hypothetical protein